MSVAPVGDRDVWERMEPAWHGAFVLFTVVTATLVVTRDARLPVLDLCLLAVVAIAYALLGGPALHGSPPMRRGVAYLAVAAPATLALFAVTPVGAVMLFVLFPLFWRLLPARWAVLATVVTVGGVGMIGVLSRGTEPADVPALLALLGATLLTAVLLGLWITTIVEQSARRAALLDELHRTREQLADAHRAAGAAVERERIARDIHDTLAQGFTSLLLLTRAISDELDRDRDAARRHLAMAERTAEENLAEARALVDAGAPAALDGTPVHGALRSLVVTCADELGIESDVRVRGADRPLPDGTGPALLRITQEAIANVRKHSGATRLDMLLDHGADGVRLTIADDGCGFDPLRRRTGARGLDGMRARAAELGGTVTVDSAPGAGCTLTAALPAALPARVADPAGRRA